MAKLPTQRYELLLQAGTCWTRRRRKPVDEYGSQLRLKLRVAEGDLEGSEFVVSPNQGAKDRDLGEGGC